MGLEKCDLVTNEMTWYTRDPLDPQSLSNNVVKTILYDDNGVYWIGTEGGLNKFDSNRKKFETYSIPMQIPWPSVMT